MGLPVGQREALRMLAGSPDGCPESLMLAHGFKVSLLTTLVLAGLAVTNPDSVKVGGRTLNVVRFKITDAGRRALAL